MQGLFSHLPPPFSLCTSVAGQHNDASIAPLQRREGELFGGTAGHKGGEERRGRKRQRRRRSQPHKVRPSVALLSPALPATTTSTISPHKAGGHGKFLQSATTSRASWGRPSRPMGAPNGVRGLRAAPLLGRGRGAERAAAQPTPLLASARPGAQSRGEESEDGSSGRSRGGRGTASHSHKTPLQRTPLTANTGRHQKKDGLRHKAATSAAIL